MENKKIYYTSGEFAKMNGINKRTLHYYHEIGLFSPAMIGENGYFYYTCFQFAKLELILTLRRIGFSIEDIRAYTGQPSDDSLAQLIREQKAVIDRSIEQLLHAKAFLQKKSDKLKLGLQAEHGKVEMVTLPEQRILLSPPITGLYDEEDFVVATDFSQRLRTAFGLYDSFGSRMTLSEEARDVSKRWHHFFAYGSEEVADYDYTRPAGTYLRSFCIGDWNNLEAIYENIYAYADAHDLVLDGYSYEEGLNEMSLEVGISCDEMEEAMEKGFEELSLKGSEDYIAMITVACKPRE